MADKSSIEWTDATWTPIRARNLKTGKIGWHCEHVSEGCRFCYAESMNRRLGTGLDFKPGHRADLEMQLDLKMLVAPLRWKEPRRIFVCSMTDLFADFVPDDFIDHIFAVMALASQHTFQVLTKRPQRMRQYCATWFERLAKTDPSINHPAGAARFSKLVDWSILPAVLPNVWLGTSAEDQAAAEARIPDLLATPAAVRFLSAEPLLGPIRLFRIPMQMGPDNGPGDRGFGSVGLDWVIVGGESGAKARPMHPDWVRSLRAQCAAASVPFFFKQWGSWNALVDRDVQDPDWRADYTVTHKPGYRILNLAGGFGFHGERVHLMHQVGKKAAGRNLDGVEHNGMPGG